MTHRRQKQNIENKQYTEENTASEKKTPIYPPIPNSTTNQQETKTNTQEENLSQIAQTLPHPQW